jgi:site-specific recombinase XerC
MPIQPQRARAALPHVEPDRVRSGWPVGLRDGAILALLAAGLTSEEICELRASSITMDRGNLMVTIRRHGVTWKAELPSDLGARLLAWLTERRQWADSMPVFSGPQGGQLSRTALNQILFRYWQQWRTHR